MTQSDEREPRSIVQDVALIVGGGPGISSSCARLFSENGMRVAVAARNPDKPALQNLERRCLGSVVFSQMHASPKRQ